MVFCDFNDAHRIEGMIDAGKGVFMNYRILGRTGLKVSELGFGCGNDGKSETNLGSILKKLGSDVWVGTKIMLTAGEMDRIEDAVVASVNERLKRLHREKVDLMQIHNPVSAHRRPDRLWVGVDDLEKAGVSISSE